MTLGTIVAVVTLAMLVGGTVILAVASRDIAKANDWPPLEGGGPMVSIIIAARDEAANIESALTSVLRLQYEPYEAIVVDDRSTDGTSEILDRMSHSRLRVVHITDLPRGWLGKNHALQQGAAVARGELLLFSDADVVFEPTILSRAVRFMNDHAVDHLALAPDVIAPTIPLQIAVTFFAFAFAIFTRPWRVSNPQSRSHIGIGAFNLVRAAAYRRAGGHDRIALRPDDDLKLGKILKMSGARQQFATARNLLSVEWYRTVPEFVRGLQKNSFSSFEYNTPLAIFALAFTLLFHLWPYVALILGIAVPINAAIVLLHFALFGAVAHHTGYSAALAFGYPIGAAIFIYTVALAVALTLRRGGIEWRGTRYSLADLRKNRV